MTLSIIIPIYNAERYLKACINSIIHQKFSNFELLLIDDGSSDNSYNLCKEIALTDARIKVFHQNNEGPASARNKGLECANGQYIGFCDSDDIVDSNYYQQLIENAKKEEADISGVSFKSIDEQGFVTHNFHSNKKYIFTNEEGFKAFLIRDKLDIHVWTKVYRKSFLDNYDIRYEVVKGVKIEEDFLFNLQAFRYAQCTVFEDVDLYIYLKKESSLSRDYYKHNFHTYLHYSLYRLYKVEAITNESFPQLLCFAKRQTILYMVLTLSRCAQMKYQECEPYFSYVMRYLYRNRNQVIRERNFWGMSKIGVILMTHVWPRKYHFYRRFKDKTTR